MLCEREHAFYGLINTLYTFGVWEVGGGEKTNRKHMSTPALGQRPARERDKNPH